MQALCRPHHTQKAARFDVTAHSLRLHTAKAAATAAAVVATTAALTAGVASSAPEALAAHNRSVQADVELTASNSDIGKIPDIVGIYGVGPIFWTAQLLGITPENVIRTAGGLTGNTALAETVIGLLDLLDAISPVEAGVKGPMPDDVYNAVNGLDYTFTGLSKMFGLGDNNAFINWIAKHAPVLNQRRDIILSESLGGLTTSLAYRDMINAVQSDDPEWGVGVTGQWLIFVNNVSRPGGGLFALATPLTNLSEWTSPRPTPAATPMPTRPRCSTPRSSTSPGPTTRCRMCPPR